MGIPRLTSHLYPFLEHQSLGCSNPQCSLHTSSRKLIIDGPALAHHLYHTLLQCSSGLNALDAQPSYAELGQAVVEFLDELQECGLKVYKIYFDGGLPLSKRPIRQERLESGLRRLVAFQNAYPNGAKVSSTQCSLSDASGACGVHFPLAGLTTGSTWTISLPTAPFLVPAVIEALKKSSFDAAIELVPGEADSFCAVAARDCSGEALVLSSDSDLLIHDLGPRGAVAFFRDLQFSDAGCLKCGAIRSKTVTAMVGRRERLEQKMSISEGEGVEGGLVRVAWQVKHDSSTTLAEAVVRSRRDLGGLENQLFKDFAAEYAGSGTPLLADTLHQAGECGILQPQDSSSANMQDLDPRVSEFLLQIGSPSLGSPVHVYMPLLHEDPSRVSAWAIHKELRQAAYSMVMNVQESSQKRHKKNEVVIEISRRGFLISPLEIPVISVNECREILQATTEKLKSYKDKLHGRHTNLPPTSPHFWRACGMLEVRAWYTMSGRTAPEASLASRVVTDSGANGSNKWCSWQHLQLSAQLQAALYSLRTAKQLLGRINDQQDGEGRVLDEVHRLVAQLDSLPGIAELMPTGGTKKLKGSMGNIDSELSYEQCLMVVNAGFEVGSDIAGSQPLDAAAFQAVSDGMGKKSKAKKRKGASTTSKAKRTSNDNYDTNMYSLLADDA